MGPDGMDPLVMRELVHTKTRVLIITFERSWRSGEMLRTQEGLRKKGNVTPKWARNRTQGTMGQNPWGGWWNTSFWRPSLKTRWSGVVSLGSPKVVRCLIAFYNETSTWMDEGTAVSIVCLRFSKAFNTLSQHSHRQTQELWTGWTASEVDGRSQRVIIRGRGSS